MQLGAETPPGWLDGEPPGATGQPKFAPYPAGVTGKQVDAPAVVATDVSTSPRQGLTAVAEADGSSLPGEAGLVTRLPSGGMGSGVTIT